MAISTIRNYNLFKIDLLFTFIYRLLPQKPHSQEEFSMLNKERLKNVFYDMVKIYSPSKGEGEICAWVMDYLRARGLEPEIDEAGKAYIAFDNRIWDETGDNSVYRCYEFKMFEKNGVGFTITQVEVEHEGKSGAVRSATLNASDMKASGINGDIAPYGSTTISGGFPKGEFLRCGIAVYGNDANGAPLTFYSLIEF